MPITFVGAAQNSAIDGATFTLDVGTAGAQEGDYILAVSSTLNRAGSEGTIGSALGYQLCNIITLSNSNRLYGKVYRATDGSTISVTGSGNTADGMSAVAMIFRGVDPARPLAVGTNYSFSAASTNPNPGAVTPRVNNACVVIFAGSNVVDASPGTVTNYTSPANSTATATDTNPSSVSAAYRILSGGSGVSEDPGAWSTWSSSAWIAYTVALKPIEEPNYTLGQFTAAGALNNASSTVTSAFLPGWHVCAGDLMFFGLNINSASPPASITVTDLLGNVWNNLSSGTTTSSLYMAYSLVTKTGLTRVFASFTSVTAAMTLNGGNFCGPIAALDLNPSTITDGSVTTHSCPATGTLNADQELVIAAIGGNAGLTGGATVAPMLSLGIGTSLGMARKLVTARTTTTPQFTTSLGVATRMGTATFILGSLAKPVLINQAVNRAAVI